MKSAKFSIIALTAVLFYSVLGVTVMAQDTDVVIDEGLHMGDTVAAFSDLDESHINYDAIMYVAGEKIVEGYPDGTYKPDQTINRAEFTKIIAGAALGYSPEVDDNEFDIYSLEGLTFSDIEAEQYYIPYLRQAVESGMIDGYPDGTYKPENEINFAEAAKIIVEGFGFESLEDPDVWYKGYVDVMGDRHAIPVSIESFDHKITRGEMAEMVYRIKAIVSNKESTNYDVIAGNMALEEAEEMEEEVQVVPVSLYFGKSNENAAASSYPVYFMDCWTAECPIYAFDEDEWTLNTKDRVAFDIERNTVYYAPENGVYQIKKFDLTTRETTDSGFESRHNMSRYPYINGDTMAVAVSDSGVQTVVKYDLATGEESYIDAFSGYTKCTWPAVTVDEKVMAMCNDLDNFYVVDEDGEIYYTGDKIIESLVIDSTGLAYFVEEGFIVVLDTSTKVFRGTDVIPPYHIVYTLTISPNGAYLAGMGEISGEWVVGIFDRDAFELTMPIQLENEPGVPSFGPYLENLDRSNPIDIQSAEETSEEVLTEPEPDLTLENDPRDNIVEYLLATTYEERAAYLTSSAKNDVIHKQFDSRLENSQPGNYTIVDEDTVTVEVFYWYDGETESVTKIYTMELVDDEWLIDLIEDAPETEPEETE